MPIYEYYCSACNKSSEFLQKHTDAPKSTCPKCGKDSLEKKISAAGFQLKGTGWYVTDFRDKNTKKESTATESAKPETKKEELKKKDTPKDE